MIWLGKPVLDIVFGADPSKDMGDEATLIPPVMLDELDPIAPTEGMSGGGRDSGARNFSLRRAPVEAAMVSQSFSRM